MRVTYKAGEIGFTGDFSSGAQWRTPVGAHEELYFAYDIYFSENYEFTKGGKIPGLMGGPDIHTGGNTPDSTTGWAGRLNWRVDGKPVTYMYTYDYGRASGARDVSWDDGPGGQQYFIPGQWHRVQMRYKMNTPGKNDDIHQAWIDGELAVDMTLGYRTTSSVKIDEILFSTFYGGSDKKSFAPLNDHYIYFDNFFVSTQPIIH